MSTCEVCGLLMWPDEAAKSAVCDACLSGVGILPYFSCELGEEFHEDE